MKSHWIHGIVLSVLASFACVQAHAQTQTPAAPAATTTTMTPQQAGEKFMQDNKAKPGVVTLPSGLQYQILEQGTGKKPGNTDTVTVDYEGRLVNGKVFDSSYQRGQPATFALNQVIPGWTEGLQLMTEGSTWMLFIPPNLAYGSQGAGGVIGPNETLVLKVHLISVK